MKYNVTDAVIAPHLSKKGYTFCESLKSLETNCALCELSAVISVGYQNHLCDALPNNFTGSKLPLRRQASTLCSSRSKTDPLTIRSSPDGPVNGLVPKGWQVVTGDRDATGQWVKIGGEYSPSPQNLSGGQFANAPDFRVGWVNRAYLKPLGNFCEKPLKIQRGELKGLSQERQVLIHEDWLQIADRIASKNSQK